LPNYRAIANVRATDIQVGHGRNHPNREIHFFMCFEDFMVN